MDNFNKVFSFILGLIVVVVFLAVITNRLNLRDRIAGLRGKKQAEKTISVTPTEKPKPVSQLSKQTTKTLSGESKDFHSYQKPNSIPATGVSPIIFFLAGMGLVGGNYLRKKD